MAATIRIYCTHKIDHALQWANEALEWGNELNKLFRHPIGRIDGRDVELAWDRATEIEVAAGETVKLQVFLRAMLLHWCGAETEIEPMRDGETKSFEYHVDFEGGWVKRGHLDRMT